jgi:hypothetical protein
MANLTNVAMDVGFGAVLGVAQQVADNYDAKNGTTSQFKKIGNYIAFGVPLLGIAGAVTNFIPLPKNWTDKMIVAGGVLAGMKATQMFTKQHYKLTYSATAYPFSGSRGNSPAQWAPANRGAAPYNVTSPSEVLV